MARNSFSNLAHSLFRAGLLTYVASEQAKSYQGMPVPLKKEEEIVYFPEESARVQRFRIAQSPNAATKQKQETPKIKIDKVLHDRALADYQAARGTTHRRLLVDAEPQLQTEARAARKHVNALLRELTALEAARDLEMHHAVVRPIVEAELQLLPSIGPRMSQMILSEVFMGHLDDLRQARRIDGIGLQKQAAIDDWVDQLQARLPALLLKPFHGKRDIEARYQSEIDELSTKLAQAQKHAENFVDHLRHVYQALEWLMPINVRHFELAIAGESAQLQPVESYLLGVYPPWEPPPEWFVAALETAGL